MTEVRKQGPPDARRLVASVLAVVEREAGHEAARDVTFRNLLGVRELCRAAARGGPRRDLRLGWQRGSLRSEIALYGVLSGRASLDS